MKTKRRRSTLWIGGSPCSGKSTIVDALCRQYGWQPYHCDEHWDRHLQEACPKTAPRMADVRGYTWDQVWMRDVPVLIADELAIYREQFPMILRDLLSQEESATALAEGAALLPECVAPHIDDPRRAIWIVPTEEFQRRIYATRGPWVQEILQQCADPQAAWEHWMGRDAGFAQIVADQAQDLGLRVVWVDGQRSLEENRHLVEEWFQPYLSGACTGPYMRRQS